VKTLYAKRKLKVDGISMCVSQDEGREYTKVGGVILILLNAYGVGKNAGEGIPTCIRMGEKSTEKENCKRRRGDWFRRPDSPSLRKTLKT